MPPLSAVTPIGPWKPPAAPVAGGPSGATPTNMRNMTQQGANLGSAGNTNARAISGALAYKDALGLPSWQDILGQFGPNGTSTKEFGNAGAAGTGADYLKGELDASETGLAAQQKNIAAARAGILNPTGTRGFKDVMRLTNERAGQSLEAGQRQAAEAASRRGYVGGYNPDEAAQAQNEAVAQAGYEAADSSRKDYEDLLGNENQLYGSELGQYGNQLQGYTNLTQTEAELPTKWLSAYSGLLGGLGGNFGDIFSTASKNAQFDETPKIHPGGQVTWNSGPQRRAASVSPGYAA